MRVFGRGGRGGGSLVGPNAQLFPKNNFDGSPNADNQNPTNKLQSTKEWMATKSPNDWMWFQSHIRVVNLKLYDKSFDIHLFFQNLPPFPAVSVTSASQLPEIKIELIHATNWALLFSIHLNRNKNINPVTPIKRIWPLQIPPRTPLKSCKFSSK